ncbi:MAG TPA: cupin domain-containing protein [Actinocrinis sp.]|jgi:mannose-6-phosphate isomerase-like protein (cupin superfamily)|uniref:cupin domain-containing protein n=1 Tax=Actinocrinis sp. TaxID=1920516 RepID=UPI002DDD377A|nr:cupin domain-containing protein [Actinocrinis sp.]HEV3169786.1 cupin domain-containing protein [Actinocrinis sp.]
MSYPAEPSYPADRYHGDTGEVSATFRPVSAPAAITYKSGGQCHYLATTASTGGEFGLYRWDFSAAQAGPDTHFHKSISESFFILHGTVKLFNGETWIEARQGDFLYVPAGGLHAFKNESGQQASMLLLFAPGAPREGYFEGLLKGIADDQRAAFMLKHDTYWV